MNKIKQILKSKNHKFIKVSNNTSNGMNEIIYNCKKCNTKITITETKTIYGNLIKINDAKSDDENILPMCKILKNIEINSNNILIEDFKYEKIGTDGFIINGIINNLAFLSKFKTGEKLNLKFNIKNNDYNLYAILINKVLENGNCKFEFMDESSTELVKNNKNKSIN